MILRRILLADPSEAIQKAIKIALKPFDTKIYTANSFEEILESAKKNHPELVLIDANLLGSKTSSEIKELVHSSEHAPLLLLQGSFQTVKKELFQSIGLNFFIKKPFDLEELSFLLQNNFGFYLKKSNVEGKSSAYSEKKYSETKNIKREKFSMFKKPEDAVMNFDETSPESSVENVDRDDQDDINDIKRILRQKIEQDLTNGSHSIVNTTDETSFNSLNTKSKNELRALITSIIKEELSEQIEAAVKEYCRQDFRGLAIGVIEKELKKLASESSK